MSRVTCDKSCERATGPRDITVASRRVRLAWIGLRAVGPSILRRPPVPRIEAGAGEGSHSLAEDWRPVRHHYGVSNDFYRLILGPSMTYSCAYFVGPRETLANAQARKHELISRKLQLARGDRLLDLGCGWGSMLIHAAARRGVRGVDLTLSESQAALARQRVKDAGLSKLVEVPPMLVSHLQSIMPRLWQASGTNASEHGGCTYTARPRPVTLTTLRLSGSRGSARGSTRPAACPTVKRRFQASARPDPRSIPKHWKCHECAQSSI